MEFYLSFIRLLLLKDLKKILKRDVKRLVYFKEVGIFLILVRSFKWVFLKNGIIGFFWMMLVIESFKMVFLFRICKVFIEGVFKRFLK